MKRMKHCKEPFVLYYELASQMIRDLMFTKKTKRLRDIDELVKYIEKRYTPQTDPLGCRDIVATEYCEWIQHFIKVPSSCPNIKAAKIMYKILDGFDAFENRSNAPF